MRTNFANRTGLRGLGCGAVAAALLLLGSAGTQAQPFASPVGTWDLSVSGGGQRGVTFLTFTDDGTGTNRNFTGYELLVTKKGASSRSDIGRNTDPYAGRDGISRGGTNAVSGGTNLFGFSSVGGPWTFDNKGRIMGFFTLLVGAGTVTTSKVACVDAVIPYVVINGSDHVDYTSVTNISFCFTNEFGGSNQGQQIISWNAVSLDNRTNEFATLFTLTESNLAVKVPFVTTNAAGLRLSSANTNFVFPYITGIPLSTNAVVEIDPGEGGTDVTNVFTYGVNLVTTNIPIISQGFTTNAISFVGKVSAGRHLTMSASTSYGKLTFNGVPFRTNLTDLSGPWAGNKILGKQKFLELFTLTPSDFPNIYFLDGSGPGFNLAGYAVTTARKQAGFTFYTMPGGSTSNILSATLGSLHTGKTIKANTTGVEEPGVNFKFNGEKLNP